jgi:uncharacterized protein YndB with AHSA1/START domain
MSEPVRVEVEQRFAVSVQDGFDYITDPDNWPEYWPGLIRVTSAARWREPGDEARLVLRLLRREVELEMRLVRFEPYQLVEYTSDQRGLPAARHWRYFDPAGEGLAYRIAVEYRPRFGWRGLFDRLVVRRSIERTIAETMANLERRFRERSSGGRLSEMGP